MERKREREREKVIEGSTLFYKHRSKSIKYLGIFTCTGICTYRDMNLKNTHYELCKKTRTYRCCYENKYT